METNTPNVVAETTVKKVKTPRRRDYMIDYYFDLYTDGTGNCYSDADSGL
jgi:hypothetical protein